MPTTYFKRLRMEINLRRSDLPNPELPDGYEWRAWHPVLTEAHARVKWESFRSEIDAVLFPAFVDMAGCRRLMRDISHRRGFVSHSTWLICRQSNGFGGPHPVATIQGVSLGWWRGSIQNVGVVPEHRGMGLGRALLLKSLHGFREQRFRKVTLEVTADNALAVALYQKIGFRHRRTSYRAVAVPETALATS
jgi:ribosomal protein S18 acetylase RimI-like enzyme